MPLSTSPTPTISVVIPSATNLILGQNYKLQIANSLNTWADFGDVIVATNTAWTATNFWNVANTNQMLFRLQNVDDSHHCRQPFILRGYTDSGNLTRSPRR